MSKESNIDKLFRDSLQDNEFEFNDSAWAQMEDMLDAQVTGPSYFWHKVTGMAASFLILASVTGYWSIDSSQLNVNPLVIAEELPMVEADADQPLADQTNLISEEVATASIVNMPQVSPAGVDERPISQQSDAMTSDIETIFAKQEPMAFMDSKREASREVVQQEDIEQEEEQRPSFILDKLESLQLESDIEEWYVEEASDPVSADQIVNLRHGLSIFAANTFNHGFSNKSGILGGNIIHAIGFQYSFAANDRISLVTGLNYSSKAGNGIQNFQQEEYGFGKTTTSTGITTRSLHYVELPLMADISFARKHHINGGVNLSYLVAAKHRVSEEQTETLSGTQETSSIQWGMKDSYQPLDVSLRVGYDYELSTNFKIGVNAQFGVLDYTVDDQSDRHQEVQLKLTYNLAQF